MKNPKVIIMMGTYNGARYLAEQLDSIRSQSHQNWEIWISDDASTDDTITLLKEYQLRLANNKLNIDDGPHKGFSANFMSLIPKVATDSDYYAYSDQDDIWDSNKLERALLWLSTVPADIPALYCSRTKIIDANGNSISYSPLFKKRPSFLNALVQNIGGGNSMVFNHATLNLLRSVHSDLTVVAHDWWTYLLVTGAGGEVYYDPCSTLCYRQHAANLSGSNIQWSARFRRINMLFKGCFRKWIDINAQALLRSQHLLTERNSKLVYEFMAARNAWVISRVFNLLRLKIYRQTFLGNMGLIIGALFNKI